LYAIREAISEDLKEKGTESSDTEVEALREENKKLKYRISHMKRYL
jgi:hypothetical protein